jgi:hypothetical protein
MVVDDMAIHAGRVVRLDRRRAFVVTQQIEISVGYARQLGRTF